MARFLLRLLMAEGYKATSVNNKISGGEEMFVAAENIWSRIEIIIIRLLLIILLLIASGELVVRELESLL